MTRIYVAVLSLALLVGAAPASGTSDEFAHVSCTGGGTDISAVRVGDNYLGRDGSVWEETNERAGLQRTPRTCVVTDEHYRVIDSYNEYEADAQVGLGGAPSLPPVPPLPPVPRCVGNICLF